MQKRPQARADKAKVRAKQYLDEASKLTSKKIRDIPRTYQYKGEKGVRTVYKSPQNARKAYEQSRQNFSQHCIPRPSNHCRITKRRI